MKKTIKYIFATIVMLMVLSACSEDREMVKQDETVPPELSGENSPQQVAMSEDVLEETFETFSWTAAGFGFQSANPEYELEASIGSDAFDEPVSLASTEELEVSILNSQINQVLMSNDATPGEPVNVYFRVTASIHEDIMAISNTMEVTVTPMEVIIDYPELYVTGSHNGWVFDDESVIYSMESNDVYEGYIYLYDPAGSDAWPTLKLSYVSNWDNAENIIGDPDESGTSGTLQIGDWGGNNIAIDQGAGYYQLKADLENQTYSYTKTEWAVTGDFTDWGFEPMEYDEETDTWSVTMDVTAGGFKFIANEDWNFTYGDDEADGILDPGTDGNNIPIEEAGNYTITLDLSDAPYVYSVEQN